MNIKPLLLSVLAVFTLSLCAWADTGSGAKSATDKNRDAESKAMPKKILVVYFSHSGNTRFVANQIHDIAGGDLFEIVPVSPYPDDYDAVVDQAKREQQAQARPALKTRLENAQSYDVIFIGYPNWWGTFPMPVATFLEQNDFSGKTIVPFCTNEGSRMGRSESDLRKFCPNSTILSGLPLRGRSVKSASAHEEIVAWIGKLGIR